MNKRQQGITLIEVLISMVLLSVSVIGMHHLHYSLVRQADEGLRHNEALQLAESQLHRWRLKIIHEGAGVSTNGEEVLLSEGRYYQLNWLQSTLDMGAGNQLHYVSVTVAWQQGTEQSGVAKVRQLQLKTACHTSLSSFQLSLSGEHVL